VFIHFRELMVGQPSEDWLRLFGRTEIGNTWMGLVVLALLGFMVLKANRLFRGLWAAALLGLESWSGHAAAYDPVIYSVGLNYIHTVAAAIWAGGLAFLLVLWFEERKDAGRFAVVFSRAAWISIALMALTGVLTALLFIPSPQYLFYTSWGTLLLIKTGLVLLVIIVGALLRLRVRGGHLPDSMLLKADVTLMALIIAVVGIFTYISPLPANEPVSHHQMGEKLHVTLRVSPNVPGGDNRFLVKVWLPDELGKPKSVTLLLKSEDRPELGPIEIPIKAYEDEEVDAFTGFTKATYQTEGPYIPFAGNWQAQIRVMDVKDNELVYERSFRNY